VAKQRTSETVYGIAEVRVIKDVEELGTQTKVHFLGEMKLALQGDVCLRGSEPA
jgi:hypothetical protein